MVPCLGVTLFIFVLTTFLAPSGFALSDPQPFVTYSLGKPTKRNYCTEALLMTQPPYPCKHLGEVITYDESVPHVTAPPVIH